MRRDECQLDDRKETETYKLAALVHVCIHSQVNCDSANYRGVFQHTKLLARIEARSPCNASDLGS